jgi:hypothetical protein
MLIVNSFINDLPNCLQNCPESVSLCTDRIDCLLYADDVIIFSNSANELQERLNALVSYCDTWCLNVNLKKTKVLIFNKRVQSDTLSEQFCKKIGKSCINKLKREGLKTSHCITPICELKHWPILLSTFFTHSTYPKQWCEGYIIPIHKSGDIHNPDNNRGIAINSCVVCYPCC